jgi:hypothetical protein
VFLADTSARHYGYDLMKAAGLPSGTLYPMLARPPWKSRISGRGPGPARAGR